MNGNYKWDQWTGNKIGPEGARMISEGLKSNSTLTEMYLWGDEKRMMKKEKKGNRIINDKM